MSQSMQWVSALSTEPSLEAAIAEVVNQAQAALEVTPDLGLVFISSAFASEYPRIMPLLRKHLSIPHLIGCSGGGVVGMSEAGKVDEVEHQPALSLSLAALPDVEVQSFHIDANDLPDLDSSPNQWVELIGVSPEANPHFILLSDPFTSNINELLQGLDFAYPGSVKVGGLAGASSISNQSGLFCNYQSYDKGTVGIALSGNIVLEAIVAQGCRPIGQPYRVVEGDRNILLKLAALNEDISDTSRTPLELLQDIFKTLDADDQRLLENSLFVGIAQSEFKQVLEQGDFLIRTLIGVDPRNGAIAIGDRVRPGQRIQFHLRDANASADDLETLLQRYQGETLSAPTSPVGALMFACVGRGEGLYGQPNFDSRLFQQYFNVPLSGFFCGGEIGPVGRATFLHGYTSVFGICRQLNEG
ncbi:MAG: hypothetical protein HC881_14695 [Leptolyngbyaceae cyanobacterium SL_7_1]|nr:hypothetical protein [Leptolyngbyaceae cyanobacterium SL_7_1]